MEHPVDDDAVELFIIILVIGFSIGANGVERDDDVAIKYITFIVVESDDIGELVMSQIFMVHFENLIIVAEEVADLTHLTTIGCGYSPYPSRGLTFLNLGHSYALTIVCYHPFSL